MFPPTGYKILKPPDNYVPIRTPARKLMATPTPLAGATPLYQVPSEQSGALGAEMPPTPVNLPFVKPEDYQYFAPLLKEDEEIEDMTPEEARERKIMKLLLKVKNGTPPMRKQALRQLTDKAREFGAGPLFNQILPLLMSPTLEDQERHLLVKVIDRVLYKLDDLVRSAMPSTTCQLMVISYAIVRILRCRSCLTRTGSLVSSQAIRTQNSGGD